MTTATIHLSTQFHHRPFSSWSRDSVVGVTTGYGLDDRVVEVRIPIGSNTFSTSSRPALGSTQSPIEWGTHWTLSPGVERPGREADQRGSILLLLRAPPWRSTYLVYHRDNFAYCSYHVVFGRAIAQAISRLLPFAAAPVQAQVMLELWLTK
jgi:hypothetical protein